MRHDRFIVGVVMVAALAGAAHAQDARCGGPDGDLCQKSLDLFAYMAPQLGTLMAGGNATLGQAGALGGPGHFALSLRANALAGSVPRLRDEQVATGGAVRTTYAVREEFLPFPSLDAAVGIASGINVGVTRVGGVDALVSAYYARDATGSDVTARVQGGKLKLGYGARVGLLEESLLTPGVSVTYLTRRLPIFDLAAQVPVEAGAQAQLSVDDVEAKTTSWRVVAGKSFLLFNFAVGAGRDRQSAGASVRWGAGGTTLGTFDVRQRLTRTNVFADVGVNLAMVHAVAEIGRVSGGTVDTYNQFADKPADAARLYGSLGVRIGL